MEILIDDSLPNTHTQEMEERQIEEERAKKRGKPLAAEERPKTKSLPFSFEDGWFSSLS